MKTFEEHTKDFGQYLLKNLIIFVIFFIIAFAFSPHIINRLLTFYQLNVFALSPLEFIKTQMWASIIFAIIILLPILVYSIYLYCKEFITIKKIFLYISGCYFLGIMGFYLGLTHISKAILESLINVTPIESIWSIFSVFTIIFTTALILGFTMQLLLIIPLLLKVNILKYENYKKFRKYFILVILIILAMVTPDPTMFSTSILALPVYLSIEGGFQIGRLFQGGEIHDRNN